MSRIIFTAAALLAPVDAYQVFLKTITGRTIILDVENTDTIAVMKQKIREKEGIPLQQQRIIIAGHELPDTDEIGIHKPQELETIHLVVQTPCQIMNVVRRQLGEWEKKIDGAEYNPTFHKLALQALKGKVEADLENARISENQHDELKQAIQQQQAKRREAQDRMDRAEALRLLRVG